MNLNLASFAAVAVMMLPTFHGAYADEGQPGKTNALAAGCLSTDLTKQLTAAIDQDKDGALDLLTEQWKTETAQNQPHICWAMPPNTNVLIRFPLYEFLCVSEIRWDTGAPSKECYYVDAAVIDK